MVKAKYTISEIKKAALELSVVLERSHIKVAAIFLYGSYARGKQRDYSDIDIAVISPSFCGKNRMDIQDEIAKSITGRGDILSAIEPVGYSTAEFSKADGTTLLGEIKRTGKKLKI